MPKDDDATLAARRSRAWLVRRAEMEAARAAAAEAARSNMAAVERERAQSYATRATGIEFGVLILLALAVLLMVERGITIQQVSDCFEGAKRPHNYNCANRIAGSFWAWLIPSDMAEQLHVAQLTR